MSNSPLPATAEPVPPLPSPWPSPDIAEFGPRKVRFERGVGNWLLTLRVLSFTVVLLGTPLVLLRAEASNRFVREAEVVQGRITRGTYRGGDSYRLYIQYDASGVFIERSIPVSEDLYSRSRVGSPIVVTTLPSDPNYLLIGTITPEDVRKAQIQETAIVIVLSCLIALIRVQARKKANEELAMLREWRALPAQVIRSTRNIAVEEPDTAIGYDRTVRYRVQMPDGSVQEKLLFTSLALPFLGVGSFFTVLHEPRTKQSVVPLHTLTGAELVPSKDPATPPPGG